MTTIEHRERALAHMQAQQLRMLSKGKIRALTICLTGGRLRKRNGYWHPTRGRQSIAGVIVRDLGRDGLMTITRARPHWASTPADMAELTPAGEALAQILLDQAVRRP